MTMALLLTNVEEAILSKLLVVRGSAMQKAHHNTALQFELDNTRL